MRSLLDKSPTVFYLAADTEPAYVKLRREFPSGTIIRTERACADAERCDDRNTDAQIFALVDMLNLARTGRILGSGYSSFSEVASWLGAATHLPRSIAGPLRRVPMEVAGRHFGSIKNMSNISVSHPAPDLTPSESCPTWEDVMNTPIGVRWRLWQESDEDQSKDESGAMDGLSDDEKGEETDKNVDEELLSNVTLPLQDARSNATPLGRGAAPCRSGCIMKHCGRTDYLPCCVRRMAAKHRLPCGELRYGCASERREHWRKGFVVVDNHTRPIIISNISNSSASCPATIDIWNTPADLRWSLWDDGPACTDRCIVRGIRCGPKGEGTFPCCVRKVKVSWPSSCHLLPYGCYRPYASIESRALRPLLLEQSELEQSPRCPTREDVMNMESSARWKLWDDATCADGCRLGFCNGGRTAPCCVKRMRVVYRAPYSCLDFPHGCYNPSSARVKKGYVVTDVRAIHEFIQWWRNLRLIRKITKVSIWAAAFTAAFAVPIVQLLRLVSSPCLRRRQPAQFITVKQVATDGLFFAMMLMLMWWVCGEGNEAVERTSAVVSTRKYNIGALEQTPVKDDGDDGERAPSKHLRLVNMLQSTPAGHNAQGQAFNESSYGNRSLLEMMQSVPAEYTTPRWPRLLLPKEKVPRLLLPKEKVPRLLLPKETPKEIPSVPWAVEGEKGKSGAGLLFFAYGVTATHTLNHFLSEAEHAARSFRLHNPNISIAIVSNNMTVDPYVFNIHISPRSDLLFAGGNVEDGQTREDKIPRQWLTRLFYMAHSPFELTWALDSNVISCTPGAAIRFLATAQRTQLWGFHIMHASQNINESAPMYPHNFNIIFRWSRQTSDLLRDWLLLTMRLGVASDDQRSLHLAELRYNHYAHIAEPKVRLQVGQFRPEFGAAFYDVGRYERPQVEHKSGGRVTSILTGRVHLVHVPGSNSTFCRILNTDPQGGEYAHTARSGKRQVLGKRSGNLSLPRLYWWLDYEFRSLHTHEQCEAELGGRYQACLIAASNRSHESARDESFAGPAKMENYHSYVGSSRCPLCD